MDTNNELTTDSQNVDGGVPTTENQGSESELAQKNKELFARLQKEKEAREKVQAELEKIRGNSPASEAPKKEVSGELPMTSFLTLRKKGLSDDEIIEVVEAAKQINTPVENFAQSLIFEAWLKGRRADTQVGETTPAPSERAVIIEGKTWEEMTPQEQAKNMAKVFAAKAAQKERVKNE